jgi:deazaflavin-dependent oxidoreductase (nitroreductase family)
LREVFMMESPRYVQPSWFTIHVFNRLVRRLTRMGISVWGSRVLRVRGRSSGDWRSTVVNLHEFDGQTYLVAPRGTTQWVRNLRAAGGGELGVGRRVTPFRATEIADDGKPEVLRAYLRRWKWEINQFFQGVGPDADVAEMARIAPEYPVFLIEPAA